MNRYLFAAVCAVFAVLFLISDAEACGRCGIFGRKCHFAAPVHHAPAAVQHHEPDVNNFIFNNSFPGAPLLPAGSSVFGYGLPAGPQGYALAAQAQYVDPAMVLDRAARFTELSLQQSGAATGQFKELGAQALALNDQLNQRFNAAQIATVAISALQTNQQPSPQAAALKVSVKSNGETKAEWITPENEIKPLGLVGELTCAKCHNKPAGEAPNGFVFDGTAMTRDEFDSAAEQVWLGKMPPKSNLDRRQKSEVVEKLRLLLK